MMHLTAGTKRKRVLVQHKCYVRVQQLMILGKKLRIKGASHAGTHQQRGNEIVIEQDPRGTPMSLPVGPVAINPALMIDG